MPEIDCVHEGFTLRRPGLEDGARLHELVRQCPPLAENSLHCNILHCTDFADTTGVAERDGELVGFVTGYRRPADRDTCLLRHVAVRETGRGHGLALPLIQAVLARDFCRGLRALHATVAPSNRASRALFHALARGESTGLAVEPCLTARDFGGTSIEGEDLLRVAPLRPPT